MASPASLFSQQLSEYLVRVRGLWANIQPVCPVNRHEDHRTAEPNPYPLVPLQTKCHQYWPYPPEVMEHGSFHIRCQSEDCTIAYVFREMLVTNTEVSIARAASGPGEGTG